MSGVLYAYGNNDEDLVLGYEGVPVITEPSVLTGFSNPVWDYVVNSRYSAAAVKNNGDLYTWGDNYYGQLGTGDKVDSTVPVLVLTNVVKVAMSRSVCMAITTDGSLYVWGEGSDGRLGLGGSTDILTPTKVGSASWQDIHTTGYCTVGIQSNGTLWTWGSSNFSGNLAYGDTSTSNVPVQIGSDSDWASCYMSDSTLAVLKTSGVLWMCGNNSSGQLGISNTTTYRYLREITYDGITFKSIGPNTSQTSQAIGTNGRWYGWGGYGIEGDPWYQGYAQNILYPRLVGRQSSLLDDFSNWAYVVGQIDQSYLLADEDRQLWQVYAEGADIITMFEDYNIGQGSGTNLVFAVTYVPFRFWTKFDGQTEIL